MSEKADEEPSVVSQCEVRLAARRSTGLLFSLQWKKKRGARVGVESVDEQDSSPVRDSSSIASSLGMFGLARE